MRQAYARIGGQPKACIMLQNLHVYELSCYRNTISKGSGSGITIHNVKGHKDNMMLVTTLPKTEQEAQSVFDRCVGDQQRVTVIDNYVIETTEGYGMVVDGSTCYMELNQLKKNALGGLLVTSSQSTQHLSRKMVSQFLRTGSNVEKESKAGAFRQQTTETNGDFLTARSNGNNIETSPV